MKAKAVGVTAAFTALASMLNLIRIPTQYLLGYSYQLGDIILVIAFLLFGVKIGLATLALNMAVTMALNPNLLGVIGAPYYTLAVLTMIASAYCFLTLLKKRKAGYSQVKTAAYATAFAVVARTLIMLPMDLYVFKFLVAFVSGWSLTAAYTSIYIALPFIIIYNVTVPLYVIPVSYYVAKHIPPKLDSTLFRNSII
jgi:hypothetical protein